MRKAKRTILIATLICAVVVPVCSAGAARSKAKPKHPTALELLDRYTATRNKFRSFISKAEETVKWHAFVRSRPYIKKGVEYYSHQKVELRSDGNKFFHFSKTWGYALGRGPVSEENSSYSHKLWDGESAYQYDYSPATPRGSKMENGSLIVKRKKDLSVPGHSLSNSSPGGPLRGGFYGSNERIDIELKQRSDTMSVQPKMEEVNGSKCYVINAKAKGCEYKIWIDPGHDYHMAKAIIKRDWVSAGRPERYKNPPPRGNNSLYLKNVQFKKYDGVWVPIECDHGFHFRTADGGYEKNDYHHRITEFVINPDHDALGSFECDFVRNGARVYVSGIHGITYTWQDGQVVDENGRVIMDCRPKKPSGSARSKPNSPENRP